jgi:hypothetical protein
MIWEDECIRVVARWQLAQVIDERLHQWQHDAPAGLASCERNLVLLEVDRSPCEACQVTEPLADVKAEQHKAAPFLVVLARFEYPFDFRNRERSPFAIIRVEQLHVGSRIGHNQLLPHRVVETHAQYFDGELAVPRARSSASRLRDAVTSLVSNVARSFFAFRFAKEFGEAFDDPFVTIVRCWLGFL